MELKKINQVFVKATGQERLIMSLTFALMVSLFLVGYYAGQVKVLREVQANGGSTNNVAAAPSQPSAPSAAGAAAAPAATDAPLAADQWKEIQKSAIAIRGSNNAKVTMVEFTDFQCPYCKRHFDETAKQIEDNFVKTGKLKIVSRMLPLPFHNKAHIAAEAALCANDQKKYWQMYDLLFGKQDAWLNGDEKVQFAELAKQAGMNVNTFNSCYTSGKYKKAVDDDLALASKIGATGTPTFYIDGKPIVGALPYSTFESIIKSEL
jgi:protein-disulfide isomerase